MNSYKAVFKCMIFKILLNSLKALIHL